MVQKTRMIKIEQISVGYQLTIDDWFINSFKTVEKLLDYLNDRIRSDFH